MRVPAIVFSSCAIVACVRPPAASPAEPEHREAHEHAHDARADALVLAHPSESTGQPRARLLVSGCNTGCENCSLADYKSFVIGTLDRTSAELFPSPNPPQPGPGYSCGAEVAIGERVTLRAHSTAGLELAAWKPFFDTDACPCTQPTKVCTFVVTAEIAASHPRIYCGAVWRPAAAQIGN